MTGGWEGLWSKETVISGEKMLRVTWIAQEDLGETQRSCMSERLGGGLLEFAICLLINSEDI